MTDEKSDPGGRSRGCGDRRPAFAVGVVVLAALAAGCESGDIPERGRPSGACSQFNRAISRWQGRETLCPDLTASVELAALGGGNLLARHRFSPPDERFQLGPDGAFTSLGEFHAIAEWERSGFTLLPPYGDADPQPIVLIYDPRSTQWSLATPAPEGLRELQQPAAWAKRPETQPPWSETKPGGRHLTGISGEVVMDRSLGDGSTRFWRFVRQADGTFQLDPMAPLAGGPRLSFRRGHRLVPFGPGRLLEWQPVSCGDAPAPDPRACATYSIWGYALDGGAETHDPISIEPARAGRWADVGAGDDLMADEARLYVWTRATGRLRVYALAPPLTDPLDPSLLLHEAQTFPSLRTTDWDPPTQAPALKHLVLILQDGRSFDSYFGKYCAAGSAGGEVEISCEEGAACCEGLPPVVAASCVPLDANAPQSHQPNAEPGCMNAKMNDGAMDRFAQTDVAGCGDANDLSCAGVGVAAGAVDMYHQLAARGALADRFFQTYAFVEGDGVDGAPPFLSSDSTPPITENLLYLSSVRLGNAALFATTSLVHNELSSLETTWAIYAGAKNLAQLRMFGAPQFHDPDWYPYRALEGGELENDLANGELPSVSLVVPDVSDVERSEAPGHRIDRAIGFVSGLIDAIEQSPDYRDNTLILFTHLTAGGHFDHVRAPPPPPLTVDATPDGTRAVHYGPRVPLLALGRFARKNHVSHVPLEMSSIALFMEWNWLFGQEVKQTSQRSDPRAYRDTWVNNIGSLLDPTLAVPELRL